MEVEDSSFPPLNEPSSFIPLAPTTSGSSINLRIGIPEDSTLLGTVHRHENNAFQDGRHSKFNGDSTIGRQEYPLASPFTTHHPSHFTFSWQAIFSSSKHRSGKPISVLNARSRRLQRERRMIWYVRFIRFIVIVILLLLVWGCFRFGNFITSSLFSDGSDGSITLPTPLGGEKISVVPPEKEHSSSTLSGRDATEVENSTKPNGHNEKEEEYKAIDSKGGAGTTARVSLLTPPPLWDRFPRSAKVRHLLRAMRRRRSVTATTLYLFTSFASNANALEEVAEEEEGVAMGSMPLTWIAHWWWLAIKSFSAGRGTESAAVLSTTHHHSMSEVEEGQTPLTWSSSHVILQPPWRHRRGDGRTSMNGNLHDPSSVLFPPPFYVEEEKESLYVEGDKEWLLASFHSLLQKKATQWAKEQREQPASWKPLVEVVQAGQSEGTPKTKSNFSHLPSRRVLTFIPWESTVAEDLLVTAAPSHNRLHVYGVLPYRKGASKLSATPAGSGREERESIVKSFHLHEEDLMAEEVEWGEGEAMVEEEGRDGGFRKRMMDAHREGQEEEKENSLSQSHSIVSSTKESSSKRNTGASASSSTLKKNTAAKKFVLSKLWSSPSLPPSSSSAWIVTAIAADILGNGAVDMVVQSSDGELYILPDSHGLAKEEYEEVKEMKRKKKEMEKAVTKKKSRQMRRVVLTPSQHESSTSAPLSLRMKDPLQPMLTAASLSTPSSFALASGLRPADLLYVNDKGELLLLMFHGARSSPILERGSTKENEEEEVVYHYNVTSLVPGTRAGYREVLPYSIVQADVNGDCAAELVYAVRDVTQKKMQVYAILAPPIESIREVQQQQNKRMEEEELLRKENDDGQGRRNREDVQHQRVGTLQSDIADVKYMTSPAPRHPLNLDDKRKHADHLETTGGWYEVDPHETTPWTAAWFRVSLSSSDTPTTHSFSSSLSPEPMQSVPQPSVALRHHLLLELEESDVRYGHLTFADVDGDGFVDLLIPYGRIEEAEEEVLQTIYEQNKSSEDRSSPEKKGKGKKNPATPLSSESTASSPSTSHSISKTHLASTSSIDGIRVFYNLAVGPASFSSHDIEKKKKHKADTPTLEEIASHHMRGPSAACLPAYHGRLFPFQPFTRHTQDFTESHLSTDTMGQERSGEVDLNKLHTDGSEAVPPRRRKVEPETTLHNRRENVFSSSFSLLFSNEWHFGFSEEVSTVMPLNAVTCGLRSYTSVTAGSTVRGHGKETFRVSPSEHATFSITRDAKPSSEPAVSRTLFPQLLRTGDYNRDGQADVLLSSNVGPLLLTSIRRPGVLGRQRPSLLMRPTSTPTASFRGATNESVMKRKADENQEVWWKRLQQIIRESEEDPLLRDERLKEEELVAFASSSAFTTGLTWKAMTEVFPFKCTPLDGEKAEALWRLAEEEENDVYEFILRQEAGIQKTEKGEEEGDGWMAQRKDQQKDNHIMKDRDRDMGLTSALPQGKDHHMRIKTEDNDASHTVRESHTKHQDWRRISGSLRLYRDATAFFRTGSQPGELYVGLTVFQSPFTASTMEALEGRKDTDSDSSILHQDRQAKDLFSSDGCNEKGENDMQGHSSEGWFGLYEPPEYQHEHYYLLLSAVSPLTSSTSSMDTSSLFTWSSDVALRSVKRVSHHRTSSSSYQMWYGSPSIGLVHHLFWHNKDMQPQEAFVTQLPRCNGFAFSPFQVLVGLGETFSYAHHYMVGRRSFSYASLHEAGITHGSRETGKQVKVEEDGVVVARTSSHPCGGAASLQKEGSAYPFSPNALPLVQLSTREWPIFLVPNSQVFAIMHSRQSVTSKKKKRNVFPSFRRKTPQRSLGMTEAKGMESTENISELSPFLTSPDFPEEWSVVLYMPVQKYRRRLFATLFISLIVIGLPILYIRWSEWRQDELEWRNR